MISHSTPLTIIVLTHRVDKRFLRAVRSSQWADQVVVIANNLDTDWRKISDQLGVEVHHWKKEVEDFSVLRNWSLQFAKHNWVFFLDSDEWILDDLQLEVRDTLRRPEHNAYQVRRHDIFLDHVLQYGEVGQLRLTRLFDKTTGNWAGAVHERWQSTASIGQLHSPLLHEPHPNINQFVQKINAYTTLSTTDSGLSNYQLVYKALTYPVGKFIKNYIWLQGFRDGWAGLVYAYCMSLHSFLVRVKHYEKNRG